MTGEAIVGIYGASGTMGAAIGGACTAPASACVRSAATAAIAWPRTAPGRRLAVAARTERSARALDGVAIVLDASAAAPTTGPGDTLVLTALAAGAHYLDLRGEPRALRDLYERHEAAARQAQQVVCGGVGFDVAVGDYLAALAARAVELAQISRHAVAAVATPEPAPLDELTVAVAYDDLVVTPGGQRGLGELAAREGWRWRDDRWEPLATGTEQRTVAFGADLGGERVALAWPGGEVITTPRHVHARAIHTFASLTRSEAGAGVARTLARLLGPLARAGAIPTAPGLVVALPGDAGARARTRFAVVVQARRDLAAAQLRVSGHDPAAIAVACAVGCVGELLAAPHASGGVLTPAELRDPAVALVELDLTVERGAG
ncbi:MAG: hypothetical protein R2939_12540 [Kofleriaceae bacterium]